MSQYVADFPNGIRFQVDRLRRDRQELIGELTVKMATDRAVNGCLITGDFNFSSVRARQDRAKLLQQRANTNGSVDWFKLLEEFCQRVFQAEREGDPAIDLRTFPKPAADDELAIDGLALPRRHPSIIFGDGGTSKSLLALMILGRLAQRGLNVALCDWEMSGEDHRERLEHLFGPDMPRILYLRCERPLTVEADRIRRVVRENKMDYVAYDSVAFACDGPPEAAETAGRYFRAIREIGPGSVHLAHVTKGEDNDKRPFGSAFWHNGARSTWNIQAAEPTPDGSFQVALYNRKTNLSAIRRPVSYVVQFSNDRAEFRPADIADSPDLAGKLTIRQRLIPLLKRGSMSIEALAEALDERPDSVRKTLVRNYKVFTYVGGDQYGLLQRT